MNIASIDIGTNTILLLIVRIDLTTHKLQILFEDQKIPRIGEGLKPGYPISSAKEKLLLNILDSYKKISNDYKCEKILLSATNAFRIASNSDYLTKKIKNSLDMTVTAISGEEEAKLTFMGCTWLKNSHNNYLVIDIGGGSTEIAYGKPGNLISFQSLPLGVVNLKERCFLRILQMRQKLAHVNP